jgi:hypothetical protein
MPRKQVLKGREKARKRVNSKLNQGPSTAYRDFANKSLSVVQQAASILEEEIAAGVVAAKQISEQMAKAAEVQLSRTHESESMGPMELVEKFRHHTHEAVDVLVNLLQVATKSMTALAATDGKPRPR